MKESICVIGLGKVGKPILDTLRLRGFFCYGYDVDPVLSECCLYDAVKNTTAAIYIVPTPSLPNGAFTNMYLTEALKAVNLNVHGLGKKDHFLHIVSSTTTPGSCDGFREITSTNICYKPEFIRLEHVRQDLLNPRYILIGEGSVEAGNRCAEIYRQICEYRVPIKRMSLLEAELAKITVNCALTMKISLANQLYLVAKRLGADPDRIMDLVAADPRINGEYLKPGAPFGGPCLPRDNRMFAHVAERVGVKAHLSIAADLVNEAMK